MKKFIPVIFVFFSIAVAQAGLKEWIHGTPPTATPGPPDATAAKVSFAPGVAENKPVMDFMVAFAESLRVHDGAALKPLLAKNYTVEGAPDGSSASDFLMQAIVKTKAPEEIVVTAIQPSGELREASVEFRTADRPAKTKAFRFDSDGKLVSCDFFSLQRHGFF